MEQIRAGVRSARSTVAGRRIPALPPAVRDELNASIRRFAAVRSPKDLLNAVEDETGRLAEITVPLLAHHPLPIRNRRTGEAYAALAAAAAAGVANLAELALVVTHGLAAPTIPAAGSGLLASFVIEVWIAVSVRVNQVEAAGRVVDHDVLASEVASALLGIDMAAVKQLSTRVARAIGTRVARRWAAALAPVAGIAIDALAARRTVRSICALPITDHPLRGHELEPSST
jgi:hypothetical protein